MKAAFKILPELSTGKEYHLLVEAGRDSISLVWYSRAPLKVEGLFIYQSAKNSSDTTLAEDIQKLLAAEQLPHYHSSVICYNFKETLIVPGKYYNNDNSAAMLDCIYGEMPGNRQFTERLEGMDAYNIYRVPAAIQEAFSNRFFAAGTFHSNSLLIPCHQQKELYCIVYNSYIKILLFKEGKLQLAQLFDYNTPSDVAYHLLNTCAQHHIDPAALTLTLSGFIDQQSNLYEELYRYFLNITMEELPQDVEVADEIKTYPEHFFSFLIDLVTCAS